MVPLLLLSGCETMKTADPYEPPTGGPSVDIRFSLEPNSNRALVFVYKNPADAQTCKHVPAAAILDHEVSSKRPGDLSSSGRELPVETAHTLKARAGEPLYFKYSIYERNGSCSVGIMFVPKADDFYAFEIGQTINGCRARLSRIVGGQAFPANFRSYAVCRG
jgi:hypothetical protein